MSDVVNDQQESNISSGSDSTPPDSLDDAPVTPLAKDKPIPSAPDPPLPDFQPDLGEPESPEIYGTTSISPPTDPDDLLTVEQPEETAAAPDVSHPADEVSPAGPDLSNYTMPPLDDPEPEEKSATGWQTTWAIIREVGETIILTLIIFFVIQMFIRNFRVVGTSMANNLHDGQYLIIDKISYSSFLRDDIGLVGPTRGDVVVFKPPRNPDDDYVKRIVGLPGEKIQVIKGQLYVNDQLLDEPFEPVTGTYSMPAPVIVPEDQVFVLGDNRNNSNDSHNWGPLPLENIVGRAWLSYWPPDQWGAIPRDGPAEEATLKHFLQQFISTANAHNE